MNQNEILENYMRDAQGRLVPKEQVKDIDRHRDDMVRELMSRAKELAGQVARFKREALGEVQAFVELSSERYGAHLGGKKGNVTLTSYDGSMQLVRALANTVEFDERLVAAKALIDECLTEWSEGARPELRTIVHDAFSTDKKGQLATHKILSLRRIKIDDPKWLSAMEAINDALQVTGSKTYVRFYERDGDGKFVQLSLDPTNLEGGGA